MDVEQAEDLADPAAHDGERGPSGSRGSATFELQEGEGDRGEDEALLLDGPPTPRERYQLGPRRRRLEIQQIELVLGLARAFAQEPPLAAAGRRADADRVELRRERAARADAPTWRSFLSRVAAEANKDADEDRLGDRTPGRRSH